MANEENLRYPIGTFVAPGSVEEVNIQYHIDKIAAFPLRLRKATIHLNDAQLDTPYRNGGWTIRQVVHHVADSHINSYCRFKLALTEDNPVIKPYLERLWAGLPDGKSAPTELSLKLVDTVHDRWVYFLKQMKQGEFLRSYFHPEQKRPVPLYEALAMYSWHCDHHLAHITGLKSRKGW